MTRVLDWTQITNVNKLSAYKELVLNDSTLFLSFICLGLNLKTKMTKL